MDKRILLKDHLEVINNVLNVSVKDIGERDAEKFIAALEFVANVRTEKVDCLKRKASMFVLGLSSKDLHDGLDDNGKAIITFITNSVDLPSLKNKQELKCTGDKCLQTSHRSRKSSKKSKGRVRNVEKEWRSIRRTSHVRHRVQTSRHARSKKQSRRRSVSGRNSTFPQ